MFKNIKRQIKDQTREQLNHVFVPQQAGTVFTDSGNRAVVAAGILRFNRKLFVLERLENYLPNKQNFELYGGDYIYSTMNSNTDGSLNDNFLPQFANIEYSTSFVPSKDGTIFLPYELSDGSIASVYIIKSDTEIAGPSHLLSKTSGKISIDLVSGEQIKIFIYYYNTKEVGYIKILQGLADYVSSWAYIDVTPPAKPEWHTVPLVTQAADVNASTTSVTLQFKAPVLWPDNDDSGILIDPDIAGHNIYRVVTTPLTNGTSERGDNNENPQTIIYDGNIINRFVHGSNILVEPTIAFLAKYNDSAVDEIGSTVNISGTPKYRNWAALGESIDTNYVSNSNLSGTHGYIPTNWVVTGTGIVASRYSDGRRSYFTEIKTSGTCDISQTLNLSNSRKYRLDFSVENITNCVSTVYLYKGTDIIDSYQVSGIGRADRSIQFRSPLASNVVLKYTVNSGTSYAYRFDMFDIEYERSIECCSQTRNYVVNGSFENSLSGWASFGISNVHWGNSLFGYKTPTLTMTSGGFLYQITSFTSGPATVSAYVNLYSGIISIGRTGGTSTVISGAQGWKRYLNYSAAGSNTLLIQTLSDCVFSIDGVQLESGKKLTCFDDVNQNGTSTRSAAYANYSGVNFNNTTGTIRLWFHPSWMSGDMTGLTDFKYLFVRGTGTDMWYSAYNQYTNMLEFTTISGGNTGQIGVPLNITERHQKLHIVYMWSGTSSEIWVDGIKRTIDSAYTNRTKYGCSSNLLSIGGGVGLNTRCADGTIDSFMVDTKKWTAQEVLADYNATSADIEETLNVIATKTRKANLIQNSNMILRNSLTDIIGWAITNSGTTSMIADYSKPKSSDVSLKITTS